MYNKRTLSHKNCNCNSADQHQTFKRLETGLGIFIALGLVLVGIFLFNIAEVVTVVQSEGILY